MGDISLGRGVSPAADSFDYLAPELSAADLALANLESPLAPGDLAPAPAEGYDLCAPAGHASLLAGWGLDLLAIENNHASDCAADGLTRTRDLLAAAGLRGVTSTPTYLEINGLHLAFLSFDDVSSPLDGDAAAQAIAAAAGGGNLVIVSVHWGAEYQAGPAGRQEALAQQFAEAGAALIVGTHPHVLQRVEWIPDPWASSTARRTQLRSATRTSVAERRPAFFAGRRRSAFVLYSLGNALFDQAGLDDVRQSALIVVTLDSRGVTEVRAVPFVIDIRRCRVAAPDAQAADKILARLQIPPR